VQYENLRDLLRLEKGRDIQIAYKRAVRSSFVKKLINRLFHSSTDRQAVFKILI